MLEVNEAIDILRRPLEAFDRRHHWRWQIRQNGRSGGYLVLIQGGKGNDGRIFCQPGKSLDMQEDFSEWDTDQLRERVELIWDFNRACEAAVRAFVQFAKTHLVKEEQILVPRTIRVAVAKA